MFKIKTGTLIAMLVQNLQRPGGNLTGLSAMADGLIGKRMELLREIMPAARTVGLLIDAQDAVGTDLNYSQAALPARQLGLGVKRYAVDRPERVGEVFDLLRAERPDLLLIAGTPPFELARADIVALATAAGIPTACTTRAFVEAGCLLSYASDARHQAERTAAYVDKILNGADPAELPVEQPTRFELVINAKTAKALDLTLPDALLARADEVIE